MTKKSVLFVSGTVTIILIILDRLGTFRLCGANEYGSCMDVLYSAIIFFLPIIPLFLFSLITYKMSEEVFQDWWRLARIFIPLAMFLILITPAYTHNWMFPVVKGTVAVALSGLFVIISLFRITLAHRRLK
ncbi:MAG: hypothetical protein KBB77_00765 [Candidatus Moranbacteria bacterium]|nr:hypothetical protein [Candidatus Moranbacteria bacterium]